MKKHTKPKASQKGWVGACYHPLPIVTRFAKFNRLLWLKLKSGRIVPGYFDGGGEFEEYIDLIRNRIVEPASWMIRGEPIEETLVRMKP